MKKNIVIVGGSHGIGNALVKMMAQSCNVLVLSRTVGDVNVFPIQHYVFDVLKDDPSTIPLPDQIDGFVYCPGSINLKPFKMLSLETMREDMEINFFGMAALAKTIIPKLTLGASMVLYSTVAVQTGMPFHASVAAAKGAIEGFTKSLAAEYAGKIRVNCIAPSLVDTPLAARLLNNDKKREMMANRHPMKRVGTPEDIASLTRFLLQDESSWVTGQIFAVDGGMGALNLS